MTADPKPFEGRGCFSARGSFRPDSLQNRIRQFFLANPDEELTYLDLCVKFSCTLEQAHGAVRELVKRDGAALAGESGRRTNRQDAKSAKESEREERRESIH